MQKVEMRLGRPLEEFLQERYIEQGRTQREIAEELGVDDSTINRWMQALDIEARFPGPRKAAEA